MNVVVDSNPEFISRASGWISAEGTLNTDVYINRSLIAGLRTAITVQHKHENSANYLTIFNYDVDTCKTIRDLLNASLLNIWFRNIHKYGNLSSQCPVRPVRRVSSKRKREGEVESNILLYVRASTRCVTFSWSLTAFLPICGQGITDSQMSTITANQVPLEVPNQRLDVWCTLSRWK